MAHCGAESRSVQGDIGVICCTFLKMACRLWPGSSLRLPVYQNGLKFGTLVQHIWSTFVLRIFRVHLNYSLSKHDHFGHQMSN